MTHRTPASNHARTACAGAVLAIIALAVFVPGCRKVQPKPPKMIVVDAAPADTADVPVVISAIGSVEPMQRVDVRPQVSGVVHEVLFSEGQAVTPGQILFKLDKRPFEAARLQISAQLKSARIQADVARRNMERGKPLYEKKIISEGEFDALTAAADAADAAVEVQEAALRTARLNVEYTTIRAPVPGRAGPQLIFSGEVVNAGSTSLVQINQTMPVKVKFTIPEKDIDAVRAAFAGGDVGVTAWASAGSGQELAGRLSFVDNEVDPGTGSLGLKALFDNENEVLWPGQFVQVRATVGLLKDMVVVPEQAVQIGQSGSFVFVIEDGVARLRVVKPGRLHDGNVVIEEGVTAGEMVVTEGQIKLGDGTQVKIRGAKDGGSR